MLSNNIYKISQILSSIKIAGTAQKNTMIFLKEILKDTAFQNITYVSGGYVRDQVMGIQSNDLDLVVQAKNGSKQLSDFLLNLLDGYVTYEKLNPLYPTYNIVFKDNINIQNKTFLLKGADIDISDTAKARYSQDSGKNKLFIYGNLNDDALQRDFTINSLYIKLSDNSLIDPTKLGIKDIENNLLRLIPNANFPEKLYNNPKVLLRYCRFFAKYKMNTVKSDIDIMKKFAYRINSLDDQQIQKEINKIPKQSIDSAIDMMKRINIYSKTSSYFN